MPDDARALLRHDRDRLPAGHGAKEPFYAAVADGLSRRKPKTAQDAYAWLGEEFRAEVWNRHGAGAQGAYLADVTGDPGDAAAAARFAVAAGKADPASRLLLNYLAATWGNQESADFAPFFLAIKAARGNPDFDPKALFSLQEEGAYRVVPAEEASEIARNFERTPLFVFLLSFGYGSTSRDDLRKIYDLTLNADARTRLGYYQLIACSISQEMSQPPPQGAYAIWYKTGIRNEAEVRSKLDAYFGITPAREP